ncbi:hypothetical protein EB796_003267 [Bugula neritina]|uniref:Uncharacterized protein n=1 Tax=Bugula neritina TaxID=10212 RepID=A0A7J7KKC1_BUGNE|nr:hypothetical protein EB796_003267 [Bugula neritina]
MNRTKARLLALLGLVVIVTTYILTHLYSPPRSITRLDSNILQLIPAAGNKTQSDIRIVYAATGSYGSWNRLSFQGCPVSKCKLQSSGEFKYIEKADVVLFEYQPDIISSVLKLASTSIGCFYQRSQKLRITHGRSR